MLFKKGPLYGNNNDFFISKNRPHKINMPPSFAYDNDYKSVEVVPKKSSDTGLYLVLCSFRHQEIY